MLLFEVTVDVLHPSLSVFRQQLLFVEPTAHHDRPTFRQHLVVVVISAFLHQHRNTTRQLYSQTHLLELVTQKINVLIILILFLWKCGPLVQSTNVLFLITKLSMQRKKEILKIFIKYGNIKGILVKYILVKLPFQLR